jgi:hypothetical protein
MNRGLSLFAGLFLAIVPNVQAAELPRVYQPEKFGVKSDILIAQTARVRRVQFARGSNSATIRDSVIRGERNVYILGARARQTIRVNISSSQAQGGALFDVVSPDGVVLETGATTFEQELPASGNYRIVVGGSRGNASFSLNVSIK